MRHFGLRWRELGFELASFAAQSHGRLGPLRIDRCPCIAARCPLRTGQRLDQLGLRGLRHHMNPEGPRGLNPGSRP